MKAIYKMASLALLTMSVVTTASAAPSVVPNGKVTQLTVSTTFSQKTTSLSGDFKPTKAEFPSGPITMPITIGNLTVTGANAIGLQALSDDDMMPSVGRMENENGDTLTMKVEADRTSGTIGDASVISTDGFGLYTNKDETSLTNNFIIHALGTAKPGSYTGTINIVAKQL